MLIEFDPHTHYWIVADRLGEVYASERASFVADDDASYLAWQAVDGHHPSRVATEADLIETLRRHGVPPYHQISTFTLVGRLADVGLLAAAEAALSTDVSQKWRFSQATYVDADNAEVIGLLTAIGADVAAMLSPE